MMEYAQWEARVPALVKSDSLWRVQACQLIDQLSSPRSHPSDNHS
jgi:hypothetical protein